MIEGMNCYLEDSRDSAYFSKTMYTEVSLPAINQRFVDFLFCLNIPLNVVLLKLFWGSKENDLHKVVLIIQFVYPVKLPKF